MDASRLPGGLPARMRSAVGSMGHLLHSAANDEVGRTDMAGQAASTLATPAAAPTREDLPVFTARSRPHEPAAPEAVASVPPSAQAVADSALVVRVQAGDMAAFEELFNKYKGIVYRTALAVTHDPGVAEEVLQDCFYKTYTNIDRIQHDTPLSPWLHRVAVNLSCNAIKRRRAWLDPIESIAERLFADPHHSPEHVCEQTELQGTIRAIVNELPVKHRVVVVLHYLHDLSLPEIAAILDCPVGTVKSRLHYARKVLKLEIETRYLAEDGPITPTRGVQTQKV